MYADMDLGRITDCTTNLAKNSGQIFNISQALVA